MKRLGFFITLSLLLSHTAWAATTNTPPPSDVKLDEIELSGVTLFNQQAIEPALQISPGDRLERVKVIKTAENLQSLYRNSGFEQVSIQSRIYRKKTGDGTSWVLAFDVSEGNPTRIATVVLEPDLRSPEQEQQWKMTLPALQAKALIKPGEIYSQDLTANSKRLIQEALAFEEFVGAQVIDMKIEDAAPPTEAGSKKTARWVKLIFKLDLGDKVTFGFVGNEIVPSSRLYALVEEQKLVGLGKDYIGSIRSQIEGLYRSMGYANVKVQGFAFDRKKGGDRHITYRINEGERIQIQNITFDGNSVFTSEALLAQFLSKAPQLTQRNYYVADEIQKTSELLLESIKAQGYLSSKLVTITATQKEKNKVDVRIYIFEGEQTTVQGATFRGINAIQESEILKTLDISVGSPLNLFKLSEGIEIIKAKYRNLGFLEVRILNEKTTQLVRYSSDNRFAEIALDVEEGPQFHVGKIIIDGTRTTRQFVITREVDLTENSILSESKILEAEARLRKLGIFSFASIKLEETKDDPTKKNIIINVRESTPGLLAWGPGFRNDTGARAFAQVSYANLFGRNHTLSWSAIANRRIEDFRFIEGQTQLAYIWPWFSEVKELTLRPAITVSADRYLNFSATSVSFTVNLEKPLLKKPNLVGGITYSLEKIHQFIDLDKGDDPLEAADFQLGSITPSLQLDLRDNPLSPRSGFLASASFEIADPLFLSQKDPYPLGYTRLLLRNDFYQPLPLDMIFYFSLRGGFERSTETFNGTDKQSGAIPTIRTFTLGGPSSLRGFKEQQLNLYALAIRGSAAFVNYRAQIDFPISGGLHMGPFLDAASLFTDPFADPDFSPNRIPFEWRYGAGMGLHYQTPVGPVNLDWGINLKPKIGEDQWRFHFSIGVI